MVQASLPYLPYLFLVLDCLDLHHLLRNSAKRKLVYASSGRINIQFVENAIEGVRAAGIYLMLDLNSFSMVLFKQLASAL